MNNVYQMAENEKVTLKIIQYSDGDSPREWDNLGTMVCWHRRYDLGDNHSYSEPRNFLEELVFDFTDKEEEDIEEMEDKELMDIIKNHVVLLPLYLYDHSGITMNTSGFSDRWDSGQVGWIYAINNDISEEYGSLDIGKAEDILKSEVKIYDQYLTGEVYGFVLEKKVKCDSCDNIEYEEIDSCWGFYGDNFNENGIKENLPDEYKELIDDLKWAN